MNINYANTLEELKDNLAVWCPDGADATELISIADMAARVGLSALSVSADSVHMLWSWLEGRDIDLFARTIVRAAKTAHAAEIINGIFKKGATGIQMYVDPQELPRVVSDLLPIRDDLFFKKKLYISLDIGGIAPFYWDEVFYQAKKISSDGLFFYEAENPAKSKKNDADITGQIYGLFDSLDLKSVKNLQFKFSESPIQNMENTFRLIKKMCPGILDRTNFFVGKDMNKANGGKE